MRTPTARAATLPLRRGPSAANDLRIELRGVEPVAPSDRFGRAGRLVTLWFSAQISPSTFFVGALGTASFIGLGWRAGLAAIVVGNLLGSITVALLAVLGARTGAPQLQQSRLAFGRTIHFPAALTWATQVGFEALAAIFGAQALDQLFGIGYYPSLAITFVAMGIVSVVGYEAIHLFEKLFSPVLLVLFMVITVKIFTAGPTVTAQTHGSAAGAFILMVAIVFGYAVSWGPVSSDYSRYLPADTSARVVFGMVFAGLVVGMTWVEMLGFAGSALVQGVSSMAGVAHIMGGGALGDVAMIAMFAGTIAILAVEDYSGALAAQAAGVSILRPVITVLSAAVAFGVASWLDAGGTAAKFEDVLLLISYWIPPWTAVVLIDWARRGRHRSWAENNAVLTAPFQRLPARWRHWSASIAVVVGFAACVPFSNTDTGTQLVEHFPGTAWFFGGFARHVMHGGDLAFYVGFAAAALTYGLCLAAGRYRHQRIARGLAETR